MHKMMAMFAVFGVVACDATPAGLDGTGEGQSLAQPPEPEAMFAVQGGPLAIAPAPGAHDWSGGGVAWVTDETPDGVVCAIDPLPSSCPADAETFQLAGGGSAIGTEFACLCAEVTCVDAASGADVASWTWDLGRVCAP